MNAVSNPGRGALPRTSGDFDSNLPRDASRAAPLAQTMLTTASTVQAVLAGASLTEALERTPAAGRPATQALAFHAMRRLGRARAVLRQLVPRTPSERLLEAHLLVAISLLDVTPDDPHAPQYASHTVVDQAVSAVSNHKKLQRFKGLVNASLRRFLRERDALIAAAVSHPEARWNYPLWWIERVQSDYPDSWQDLLAAADTPAPMTLRVNSRRQPRSTVQHAFNDAGIASTPVGDHGLVLARAFPVTQLPGFRDGWWSVQDAGAQLAAPLLELHDGMRVLDACAAPGGKTAHMLELANINCLALDVSAKRLSRVNDNLQRLGLNAELREGDAAQPGAWWDGKPFDAVLADVPCTASGIVRRHPDIRWLRQHDDIARTVKLQKRILDALWQVVAPGGKLLYVTCSVFPAEGEQQAQAFAARHPQARRLPAPGQLRPSPAHAPPSQQHDGFFYALFTKA